MATVYNITHKRGDTLDAIEFNLTTSLLVDALPEIGEAGIVYKLSTDGLYYVWDGVEYTATEGGMPIDLTGAILLCQIRSQSLLDVALSLSTGNGLTITDAVNGKFQIDSMIIDIPVKVYKYDIQITFPTGIVKTYISGSFNITEDVSRG